MRSGFGKNSQVEKRRNQSAVIENTGRAFKLQSKIANKKISSAVEENLKKKI